ncbi:MAG TPA: SPOR domain-containing protein [Burkholderiales bacterium]
MRALFLLLVLANLAFFAWSRYVSPIDAGTDPAPLQRQIEPDKMKVVVPTDLPAAAARPVSMTGTGAPKCIEWGSFTLADAPRAEKSLEPLALGARLNQKRTEESAGWWVYIPAQGSRPAAAKKAAELKARGISDYFIVQEEGEHRWALSLGVFRTAEAAQARLAALRAQGVRSAQVGPRETIVPKIWLQVKGADAATESKLRDLAREIEGSELRSCS